MGWPSARSFEVPVGARLCLGHKFHGLVCSNLNHWSRNWRQEGGNGFGSWWWRPISCLSKLLRSHKKSWGQTLLGYVRSAHKYIPRLNSLTVLHKQRIVLVMFGNNFIRRQEVQSLEAIMAQADALFALFGRSNMYLLLSMLLFFSYRRFALALWLIYVFTWIHLISKHLNSM